MVFPKLSDLKAYQMAYQVMLKGYQLLDIMPEYEKYNRTAQLRRSLSSAPANIAEGYGRFNYQENIQYCRQARGSLTETQAHLQAAADLKQIPTEKCQSLIKQAQE
jgi:four helix bundle protein